MTVEEALVVWVTAHGIIFAVAVGYRVLRQVMG